MKEAGAGEAEHQQTFWLASRGAQQMDLAHRFAAAAETVGLRVLALKGISIADELYGGVQNRPMADIDFLVVDTPRFVDAGSVARSLGLIEVGASDHALVFKEPLSGVVLELHVSLTSCPGLFTVDHGHRWEHRKPVLGSPMFRLSDEDLVVHLALHTGFQHAFVAGEYHYRDFTLALSTLNPSIDLVLARAIEWGALRALGAMAVSRRASVTPSPGLAALKERTQAHCPNSLRRWLERQEESPGMSVLSLGFVRFELAPSKWRYLRGSAFPKTIPGRTLPRPSAIRRLKALVEAGFSSPAPRRP